MCKFALITACSIILLACGATQTLPGASTDNTAKVDTSDTTKPGITQVPLVSTLQYIPVLKVDKKGKPVPYKPAQNPYLTSNRWVSREATASYTAAKQAFTINDFATAKQQLNNLVSDNAKLSGPWVMLGDIALKQEELEQAEAHYTKATAINKRNVNAYLRLAKVQRMQGKFSLAQNTYAQSLAIWKDFPEAHLNLGVLYDLYLNDPVKAQKHIEAYQFLSNGKNTEVAAWLLDLQKRTGMKAGLELPNQTAQAAPVS